MNKKFLSAILFGALMVTSTGTFVSCKDYDDDIDNLQTQIDANSSAIAELKALLGDGNYVTSVAINGNNLVVNTKNGSTTLPLPECEGGSLAEVKDNQLFIDGVATGLYGESVKIVNGEWALLQADGSYASTGIPVSGVTVSGDKQNGYVLTITDANGETTVIELPTAASLITSINVAGEYSYGANDFTYLTIKKALFNRPSSWGGQRELPANKSKVYGVSSLDVRIDPVSAPAEDVNFYLTNTKNHTLSFLELYATPTQDSNAGAMTYDQVLGRAGVTGNGLWTLNMDQFVLSETDAKAFEKDLNDNTGNVVYAVNANKVARSEYNVMVEQVNAAKLTKVQIVGMANSGADVKTTSGGLGSITVITVNVGQTYKIDEIAAEDGLMWDMYFSAATATAVETYGLVFDHLNRTFTVTKRPDVVTDATAFELNVNTLDINGNVGVAKYSVRLSAKIDAATATYPEVIHNLANFNNSNGNDDHFTLPISVMKEALGDKWTTWANSVNLPSTVVTVHAKADLSDAGVAIDRHTASAAAASQTITGLGYYLLTSQPANTENVNNLNNVRIKVSPATTPTFKVDTQYYIKVTFNTSAGKYINHIVVPVKFTAPTVADQFALKAGYLVDGVVNAYYYDYESANIADRKSVALKHYLDAFDAEATISLDANSVAVVTASNGEPFTSAGLATLTSADAATAKLSLNATSYGIWGGTMGKSSSTYTEAGYGKELVVEAWNDTYDGWNYAADSQKYYEFKIKVMSPIFEGTITPVTGSTINVTANAETGFAITKDMIELADYNKNLYCVVPDQAGSVDNAEGGNDVWKAAQITDVWATKDANNTYIKAIELRAHEVAADGTVTQEGAIVVKADPMPSTVETSMKVNVADCWGYKKAQEVSVTIVKQ